MWEPAPLLPPGNLEEGTEFTQNMEWGPGPVCVALQGHRVPADTEMLGISRFSV